MKSKELKRLGWSNKLLQDEYEALWKWMQTWNIIKDAVKNEACEFKIVEEPSYIKGSYALFLSDYYMSHTASIKDLCTQTSVFLEGYRACKSMNCK